uniref:At3g53120 n=1 Tax=Arabidopsis thaliana TaxID=3702 RepID=Q6ID30_ARATH|nr:At3g53120 [Arabidopsis thaliana]
MFHLIKCNRRQLGEGATDNGAQKPSVYQEPTFLVQFYHVIPFRYL